MRIFQGIEVTQLVSHHHSSLFWNWKYYLMIGYWFLGVSCNVFSDSRNSKWSIFVSLSSLVSPTGFVWLSKVYIRLGLLYGWLSLYTVAYSPFFFFPLSPICSVAGYVWVYLGQIFRMTYWIIIKVFKIILILFYYCCWLNWRSFLMNNLMHLVIWTDLDLTKPMLFGI